jgi:mevalonate kinase
LGIYTACGKSILLGEHFVVHGVPALAAPLNSITTQVQIIEDASLLSAQLISAVPSDAAESAQTLLAAALELTGCAADSPWRVHAESTIPLGVGLGSSAAFSVALTGALLRARKGSATLKQINAGAHQLERLIHGAPSGIDNSVVTYGRPLVFSRSTGMRFVQVLRPVDLVVASCGYPGSTRDAVAQVSDRAAGNPSGFRPLCDAARGLVEQGVEALEGGRNDTLGALFDQNHQLLQEITVSTPDLDALVQAARAAGAYGAKLTGAGLGGCIVAVAPADKVSAISLSLSKAGADWVIASRIEATGDLT